MAGSFAQATLVRSALCRTSAKTFRPSPTMFYFPGLTSKPVHDPRTFSWVEELERKHSDIKREFLKLRQKNHKSDYELKGDEHTLHQGQWEWFSYIQKGRRQQEFLFNCPSTAQALEDVTGLQTGLPFAYAFFSALKPQSKIAPHCSPCNLRLRCHFPLIVPETDDCGMRVADELLRWEEGKCLIFDDSYEHEVWHNGSEGSQERVVLLFDIWHPELTTEERQAIHGMFQFAKDQGWLAKEKGT